MSNVKVLSAVSEIYPIVKTGGLADVSGALPGALHPFGVTMVTLVPGYPRVLAALREAKTVLTLDDLFGAPARVLAGRSSDLDLFALDAPHLFDRPGNPYTGPDGRDWPDNAFRFGALGLVAARIGLGEVADFIPDVVHAHDWQAGLAMAYLVYSARPRPRTVMTVHNLAFQGQFPANLLDALGLPPDAYTMEGVESYGAIGFLKAGLQLADAITTVSPTYAAEIQTPEQGCGLDGLFRARAHVLSAIVNGIDTDVWNPATDSRILSRFDCSSLHAREPNKGELQRRLGLQEGADRLLFGVVSRLSWQKGLDLLADVVPTLVDLGAQLALLGSGDAELEQRFAALAAGHSGRIGCLIGYSEDLAHLIQAGADALLVPSRFEPCGLTQLCALRYGAVPVVSRVGGLADTIIDLEAGSGTATGLQFSPVTSETLEAALRRTAALWQDRGCWHQVQHNGMGVDVSWRASAEKYARLYTELLAAKK